MLLKVSLSCACYCRFCWVKKRADGQHEKMKTNNNSAEEDEDKAPVHTVSFPISHTGDIYCFNLIYFSL